MYYSKIETPFERDMDGSRRLIPGKYRNPAVRAVRDLPWEWTLKVDGTSVLIAWDGHEVSIHGHTERSCLQAALVERLKSLFLGETAAQLFEQKFGATPAFLYGEGVGPKIQACGFHYGDAPDFILFDALAGHTWLPRAEVDALARMFGVRSVPVLLVGTVDEAVAFVKRGFKDPMADGVLDAEGLVGRAPEGLLDRYGHRLIVKVKARDFKEEA